MSEPSSTQGRYGARGYVGSMGHIDPTAWIAPSPVVTGDVTIGAPSPTPPGTCRSRPRRSWPRRNSGCAPTIACTAPSGRSSSSRRSTPPRSAAGAPSGSPRPRRAPGRATRSRLGVGQCSAGL